LITQEQLPLLHTPSMNDTHLEDMILINKLSLAAQNNDADTLGETFEAFLQHSIEHFKHEEDMMVEKKFPPYPHHKEEHDKALKELQEVIENFKQNKDFKEAANYIDNILTPWFLLHVETLDGVTSMFLENSEEHLKFWNNLDWEKRKTYTKSKEENSQVVLFIL
jgi:hemerythrin